MTKAKAPKKKRRRLSSSDASNMASKARQKARQSGQTGIRFKATQTQTDPKFIAWLKDADQVVDTFNRLENEQMCRS